MNNNTPPVDAAGVVAAGQRLVLGLRTHAFDDCGEKELPTHIANVAADYIESLLAALERQREALGPFANIAEQIRKTGTDERWLEQVLFYAGDDNDPSKWSLTGRAFDAARLALAQPGGVK